MNSPAEITSSPRYRWTVCALLFFATTINYMDRQILSLVKPLLDEQLHWTNEEFGWVNSAFQAAYAIGLLGFGAVIDKIGPRTGLALSVAAWSVAAMGHSLVGSLRGFFVARICLGLGEGGNFPASIKIVASWFPPRERALATAVFNSGANVGALLAPLLVPWIALTWGWKMAFFLAGLAGFVWLLFWLLFYQASEVESSPLSPLERAPDVSWFSLLHYRQAWSFIIAKFLTDPVWWFFLIWLPDYFKQTRHLDLKNSWVHLVTIYAIVTVMSIAGGWVTGQLTHRGWSITRARKTCMFFFACCVVPIYWATGSGDWVAVMLIGLAGAAHQAWSANLYTTVSDMFPPTAIARVIGMGGMAGSVGGILFPVISGRLLDHFQALGAITTGYTMLFSFCAFAYLLAFGLHHLLAPRFDPIP